MTTNGVCLWLVIVIALVGAASFPSVGPTADVIDPVVLSSLQRAAEATLVGDATGSGRIEPNLKGDRLLEVVARAGGIETQSQETYIRLLRDQKTSAASTRSILAGPQENIFVYPGDTIYVYRSAPKFTVLGAVTEQKDYMIDQDRLTLAALQTT